MILLNKFHKESGSRLKWVANGNNLTNMCSRPSITDGVHRNENFEEIIPVFSTFSNFFKQNKKKIIKAILCNFSMRFLKYF